MSTHALSVSPVAERISGAWRLMSWEASDSDGQLTYALGRMSAQLMRRNQAHFASEAGGRQQPRIKHRHRSGTSVTSERMR
jgi:hypothetical protein